MSVAVDILTPNWSHDGRDTDQARATLNLIADPVPSRSASRRGDAAATSAQPVPGQDWTKLIDLVRDAARHSRDLEAKAQEQELRVQELLQRVREDIRRAGEQVRVAEMQAREAQVRAEASVAAAEERTRAAEVRAQTAEEWLMRVREAVVNGFADPVPRVGSP